MLAIGRLEGPVQSEEHRLLSKTTVGTEATLKQAELDIAALKERYQRVGVSDRKIKILHRGGYEHFERDVVDTTPVVFRWTARTAIAE